MQKERAIAMNIGGMGNKIFSMVDRNATLIGAGARLVMAKESWMESISRVLGGNVHMLDVNGFLAHLRTAPEYPVGILTIVGAELLKDSGIPMVNRAAGIAGKIAVAYLGVRVAEALLYHCTHSDGGGSGGSTNSGGYGY